MEAKSIQHSAEVRWFQPGVAGEPTLAWFLAGRDVEPEPRTDRYLAFPGCESGGVKLRTVGDKRHFEVKLQRGGPSPLGLAPGVSGRADGWAKWSYGEGPVDALMQALMGATEGFIDVEKNRYLRRFSFESGSPDEVAPDARPEAGCGVELTQLHVNGAHWWSFAFEAFGPQERLHDILVLTARHFLENHPPVDSFTTANSCSYPAWLGGLA